MFDRIKLFGKQKMNNGKITTQIFEHATTPVLVLDVKQQISLVNEAAKRFFQFDELKEGQIIEVNNGQIYRDGQLLGEGSVLDKEKVAIKIKEAYKSGCRGTRRSYGFLCRGKRLCNKSSRKEENGKGIFGTD